MEDDDDEQFGDDDEDYYDEVSSSTSYADEMEDLLESLSELSPAQRWLNWWRCLTACKPVHGAVNPKLVEVKNSAYGGGGAS